MIYNYVPPKILASVWAEALGDLEPDAIEAACRKVQQTFKPTSACLFPTPAHVRECIAVADCNAEAMLARAKWNNAISWLHSHYTPDIPMKLPFDARTSQAIKAAGGVDYLVDATNEQLMWAQKAFVEAFCSWRKVEDDAKLLTDGEAKELLSQVKKRLRA